MLEVDVDVGRLVALPRDEALEQQARARGVDLRDVQAIADGRIGRGAAPLAEDARAAGELHDVVDREEIVFVAEGRDEREFVPQLREDFRRRARGVAPCRAFFDQLCKPARRRFPFRHDLQRIFVAQLIDAERAARGDRERFSEHGLRVQLRQPDPRTQVALGIREERVPGLRNRHAQADRGERVLQRAARTGMHVHVAGRDERQAAGFAEGAQPGEARLVARPMVEFHCDPCAPGKFLCKPVRLSFGDALAGQQQREAPGQAAIQVRA